MQRSFLEDELMYEMSSELIILSIIQPKAEMIVHLTAFRTQKIGLTASAILIIKIRVKMIGRQMWNLI